MWILFHGRWLKTKLEKEGFELIWTMDHCLKRRLFDTLCKFWVCIRPVSKINMSLRKENDKRVFRCIYQSSLSILDSYLSSPSVLKNKAKPRVFNFGWPLNRVKNNTKSASGRRKVGRDRLIRVLQPRSQGLSSYRPLGPSEDQRPWERVWGFDCL